MASGLLSLKWNNHRSTFFHILSTVRHKEVYCDVTLACDGRLYPVHKLVLSTCSEYFEQMFERVDCKHPVVVLKDIQADELEALLNYMYIGEVNVLQDKLAGLIKAAECLQIKGLAVPDEAPDNKGHKSSKDAKRAINRLEESPQPKRRRHADSEESSDDIRPIPSASSRGSNSGNIRVKPPREPREPREQREHREPREQSDNSASHVSQRSSVSSDSNSASNRPSKSHTANSQDLADRGAGGGSGENGELDINLKSDDQETVVVLDEADVKAEPVDETIDDKDALHSDLGLELDDPLMGDDGYDPHSNTGEDIAIPGASGFQGSSFSMWEGDGSMQDFPNTEDYTGDNSQARQLVSSGGGALDCPFCGKRTSSHNFQRHVRIHTGEKRHICTYCGYRTARTDVLKIHINKCHRLEANYTFDTTGE